MVSELIQPSKRTALKYGSVCSGPVHALDVTSSLRMNVLGCMKYIMFVFSALMLIAQMGLYCAAARCAAARQGG
ncbi:putative protein FAM170B isoform A [Alligator mississippiensis]|uniref:Uncharacterized protein n=1 Tax=Alligator mississippiensis TaxID=8496 RepID=A0A151N907_ALLMI|nr:putative protein FAM170B isoform A [Alligator mississippiensis]